MADDELEGLVPDLTPAPEPEPTPDPFAAIEDATEDEAVFDPTQSVTIRTTSGQSTQVPVTGPTTIADIMARSGLATTGQVEYYVNQNRMNPDQTVAPGATIMAVGVVKGGAE